MIDHELPIITIELTPSSVHAASARAIRVRGVLHGPDSQAELWEASVNPHSPIDSIIEKHTGFSNTEASLLPSFEAFAADFLDFAEGAAWVFVDSNSSLLWPREFRHAKLKLRANTFLEVEKSVSDALEVTKVFLDSSKGRDLLTHKEAMLATSSKKLTRTICKSRASGDAKGVRQQLDVGVLHDKPDGATRSLPASRKPTDEQEAIVAAASDGLSLKIEALAGTGKTTSLEIVAREINQPALYLAFNNRIVREAESRFPEYVTPTTVHAYARRNVAGSYRSRISQSRMRSDRLANTLDLKRFRCSSGELSADELASLTIEAIWEFCQSSDASIEADHFIAPKGFSAEDTHDLHELLLSAAQRAWKDISSTNGRMPLSHDHYLKIWALSRPVFNRRYETILFDEAQDANGLMIGLLEDQSDRQLILVGDSAQQIYAWNGAVNSLEKMQSDGTLSLTNSFRFGAEIADEANFVLDLLEHERRIVGKGASGEVDQWDTDQAISHNQFDVVLARSNARLLEFAFLLEQRGTPFSVVGGLQEVAYFAHAAKNLMKGQPSNHPDLIGFSSWAHIQQWARTPGADPGISRLVRLIEDRSPTDILRLANSTVDDEGEINPSALKLSTAHKSKGREWDRVALLDDFSLSRNAPEELRIRYVALTRAKRRLVLPRSLEERSSQTASESRQLSRVSDSEPESPTHHPHQSALPQPVPQRHPSIP